MIEVIDPLGINFNWGVIDPDSTKKVLSKIVNDLVTDETKAGIDRILKNYGEKFNQNFDPKPIDDAICYLRKIMGADRMYCGLFLKGVDLKDFFTLEEVEAVDNIGQKLSAYLKSTLDSLVKDVKDNEQGLLSSSSCTEHNPNNEDFVLIYYEKIEKVFEIGELLLRTKAIEKDYIREADKLLLESLRERISLYRNDLYLEKMLVQ